MGNVYNYSEYNEFNRFINIDGIESKIIAHLLQSETKYAQNFWKLLKYDTKDALAKKDLTLEEKIALIDGYNTNIYGGQTEDTRVFYSPFCDDAWTKEATSTYIYVDDIYPVDAMRAGVAVTVETVTHSKINAIFGDADELAAPERTNPNDYFKDLIEPTVQRKSRSTVLLKCILAELNGLYIDGVGYLSFNKNEDVIGERARGRSSLSLYNNKSFFGHKIQFFVTISGVSSDTMFGY